MSNKQIRKALAQADWARVANEPGTVERAKADAEVERLWKLLDDDRASGRVVRGINA